MPESTSWPNPQFVVGYFDLLLMAQEELDNVPSQVICMAEAVLEARFERLFEMTHFKQHKQADKIIAQLLAELSFWQDQWERFDA